MNQGNLLYYIHIKLQTRSCILIVLLTVQIMRDIALIGNTETFSYHKYFAIGWIQASAQKPKLMRI